MTITEFSKSVGKTPAAIRKWIKLGKLNKSVTLGASGIVIDIDYDAAMEEMKNFAANRPQSLGLIGNDETCANCGIVFIKKSSLQTCCSVQCSVEVRAKKARLRSNLIPAKAIEVRTKQCRYCGSEFAAKFARAFCSKDCALENKRAKDRDRTKASKTVIYQRDKYTCIYCGKNSIEDGARLQVDHVVPFSKGGKNDVSNLVTCCDKCNMGKLDRPLPIDVEQKVLAVIADRNRTLNAKDANLVYGRRMAEVKTRLKRLNRPAETTFHTSPLLDIVSALVPL